jgi:hypothetical protein
MTTVLEECITEDQRSGERFFVGKRVFLKKCFLFTVGSVCRVKQFTTGSRNYHLGCKRFADDEEVETEVRKWLRQQSKDFYAAGFDALVKRWDKCISVGGGCREINVFPRFEYHMFYVLYPFVTHLLTLPRSSYGHMKYMKISTKK